MKITEDAWIFKNDLGFSTTISNKKMDGTWDRMYINVQFPKNDERAKAMPSKTKIYIKNAFLSCYRSTAGMPKVKLVIMDYEILEMTNQEQTSDDPFDNVITNVEDFDDELPF